jgi:hypothetical protein
MTTTNTITTTNTAVEVAIEKPVFRLATSRALALELFVSLLDSREDLGNTEFRKSVIAELIEQQNMTLASAAATYNIVKKYAVETKLVEEFGRTPAAPKAPKAEKVAEPKLVNVVRNKDGVAVAEGVTVAEAEDIIAKAFKGKKAKLVIA